jgi:hypothetical protein
VTSVESFPSKVTGKLRRVDTTPFSLVHPVIIVSREERQGQVTASSLRTGGATGTFCPHGRRSGFPACRHRSVRRNRSAQFGKALGSIVGSAVRTLHLHLLEAYICWRRRGTKQTVNGGINALPDHFPPGPCRALLATTWRGNLGVDFELLARGLGNPRFGRRGSATTSGCVMPETHWHSELDECFRYVRTDLDYDAHIRGATSQ